MALPRLDVDPLPNEADLEPFLATRGGREDIARQLAAMFGITDNELNLRNKVSRGRFTAVFFMQCMKALDADWIKVPASIEESSRKGAAQGLAKASRQPGD